MTILRRKGLTMSRVRADSGMDQVVLRSGVVPGIRAAMRLHAGQQLNERQELAVINGEDCARWYVSAPAFTAEQLYFVREAAKSVAAARKRRGAEPIVTSELPR